MFAEQFQIFLDSVIEVILAAIRLQFSEIFSLIELFQTLGGAA